MIISFHILQGLIFFSCLICFVYRRQYEERVVVYFCPFLFFTFLIQYVGYYYSLILKKPNDFIFNLYGIIEYLFFFYFFYQVYKNEKIKQIYLRFTYLFFLLAVINLLFIQGFNFINTYTDILACISILISCGIYFKEILLSEEYIHLWKKAVYWIIFSLFIYYVGQFILIVIFPFLFKHNPSQSLQIYWTLMIPLNLILYTLFTIGFYVERK